MIRLVLAARALRAFAGGAIAAPLVVCGVLKIAYDFALFARFRRVAPRFAD
jgi:hypothetical protein